VDRGGCDAIAHQLARQAVRIALHAHEHQHLAHIAAFDQVGEQRAFALGLDFVHLVRDEFGRRIAARDFDHHRERSICPPAA